MSAASKPPATAETLIALGDEPFEVINGELVRRAEPNTDHSDGLLGLGTVLRNKFHHGSGGGDGPGGWWIHTDVDVELSRIDVVRPDLAGWTRERVPDREQLRPRPVRLRPDWACEVVSPSNVKNDTVTKMRLYREAAIPHYWLVDPMAETLMVYRLTESGYLLTLSAARGETVHAEPFDAIELRVGLLFGDE